MSDNVQLPALGESVTEGTVTRWLKQVGETVEVGAELCVIGEEGESGGSGESGGDQEAEAAPDAGAESEGADDQGDSSTSEKDTDEDEPDRKTETETSPPQATTDDTPPAQETAPGSADTKPEAESSQAGTSPGAEGTPVTLPALGESVTEGTVTRWLKQVGDDVALDEPLLEVSTDKVDTEIPSPVAGTLLEIKVQEDETVEVGAELAVIGSGEAQQSGEKQSAPEAEDAHEAPASGEGDAQEAQSQGSEPEQQEAPKKEEPAAKQQEPVPSEEPTPGQQRTGGEPSGGQQQRSGDGGPYVTPLVRKMAAEQGVDLSSIEGTGVGGRIRKQDVLDAAEAQKTAAAQAPAAAAPSQQGASARCRCPGQRRRRARPACGSVRPRRYRRPRPGRPRAERPSCGPTG